MIPITIHSLPELQDTVRNERHVRARGGGTKTALSAEANLDLSSLSGVVEYQPSEYTFTARAGTRLSEIQQLLAQHGQFMPFDPVLVDAGATIGGAIASGISGPGRFRYGGLRDFLLGVLLVNGEGDVVRGGGKVVKNAAGFDIPKLMVGSLGRYGIVGEATFKVFPRPEYYATLVVDNHSASALQSSLEDLLQVAMSPAEAACLELVPPGRLIIRVGGIRTALPQRVDRLSKICRGQITVLDGDDDQRLWTEARELSWRAAELPLVRIPIAPHDIPALEAKLNQLHAEPRRYSVGGHLLWLCWPTQLGWTSLEQLVGGLQRTAQVVIGDCPSPLINHSESAFGQRLLTVFDPHAKFDAPATAATGDSGS